MLNVFFMFGITRARHIFYCYCSASSGYFSLLWEIAGKQSLVLLIHDIYRNLQRHDDSR